jgi:hypothetical protein
MKNVKYLKEKVSTKNRKRKFELALSFIKKNDSIIDIGVDTSLGGTTNYFEKWFMLPNKLTCFGVKSDFSKFRKEYPKFELIEFDGEHYPVFEKKFDFAFSNAVIEHIGNFTKQVKWLSEIKKITKLLFITTPNRWLPFETHSMTFFFHWFPDKIRNYFYRKIGKEHYAKNYMWLLGERDFKKIIKNAGFEIVSFHKNKFMCLTIDFVAICKPRD